MFVTGVWVVSSQPKDLSAVGFWSLIHLKTLSDKRNSCQCVQTAQGYEAAENVPKQRSKREGHGRIGWAVLSWMDKNNFLSSSDVTLFQIAKLGFQEKTLQ